MSKVDAPDIEPTSSNSKPVSGQAPEASAPAARRPLNAGAPNPPRVPSRGKRIDFAPRRQKVANPAGPKPVAVAVKPTPTPTPVVERRTTVVVVPPRPRPASSGFVTMKTASPEPPEDLVDGTDPLVSLDDFASPDVEEELDESLLDHFVEDDPETAPLEEAQEDFLAEDDPEDYVEEVLSQISESRRTETTVRRSPFLKNYHIEKRPLSSRIPVREQVSSAEALASDSHSEFREEEFAERADSVPENAEEPVVTKTEKTGSRIGAIITILVTIILGAGVGVFVYLAFFQ